MWPLVFLPVALGGLSHVLDGLFGGDSESDRLRRRVAEMEARNGAEAARTRETQQQVDEMREQSREMQRREARQQKVLEEL